MTKSPYLEAPRRLRAFVRAHETSLVILAALVGVAGGLVVAAMSAAVELLHVVLFDLDNGQRLSSQLRIEPLRALLVPTLGGFLLGLAFLIIARCRLVSRPGTRNCPAGLPPRLAADFICVALTSG